MSDDRPAPKGAKAGKPPVDVGPTLTGSSETISISSSGSIKPMDEAAAAAKTLQTLPGYEIEKKIGEGGMGAVYRGKQKALNRTVAIKVLPQRLAENKNYLARLNREAMVLAKINHANVVSCYDLGEHQGMRYVVMEFVEGEILNSLIEKRKHLSQHEALFYLKQAVLGLDHANAVGVIHRDIKPENMLLAAAPRSGTTVRLPSGYTLKIADLGLASFTGDGETENTRLTTEGSTLGSPHYMSPEQTRGESNLDFRTDIYALGITLYYMVSGKLPYVAPTVGAVLARKLTEQIPDPRPERPELSPGISLLIQKMTARNKEDRYASYGELLQDIEAIERKEPMTAKIIPEDAATLSLAPETVKALKDQGVATAGGPAKSGKLPVPAIAAGVIIGVIAVVALIAKSKGPEKTATPPPAAVQTPPPPTAVPVPPPVTPPVVPVVTPPKTTIPADGLSLIDKDLKDWKTTGEAKNFGYQDNTTFLNSFDKKWNFAERKLPDCEFILVASMLTPKEVDECEVQVGLSDKEYIAYGLRLPADSKTSLAYVERRNAATHELLESFAKSEGLNPDDWHTLKINFFDGQATCKIGNTLLGSIAVPTGGETCNKVRLAVRNGFAQLNSLMLFPRPAK
jgi:eukaryotic-like serine/threonine-protein kinase